MTLASPGYPPLEKRAGEEVQELATKPQVNSCGSLGRQTEVQIGVVKTSDDGGGWEGITLTYEGTDAGEVVVPFGMVMCGTSTSPCGSAAAAAS